MDPFIDVDAQNVTPSMNQIIANLGESTYAKMRRLYANARIFGNPHSLDPTTGVPLLASGGDVPVITTPAYFSLAAITGAGYTRGYVYSAATSPSLIYTTGGIPLQKSVGSLNWCFWVTTNGPPNGVPTGGNINNASKPGKSQQAFRVKFRADASKLIVEVAGYAGYRVIVNGRYVDLTGIKTTNNNISPLLLDWTGSGGRQKRDIIIEGYGASGVPSLYGVYCLPGEGLLAMPTSDRLTMYVAGDSITASTGLPSNAVCDNFAYVAADFLGITDVRAGGLGGTGYLATSGGATWNWQQHIADITDANPDIVVFANGTNDFGNFTNAQILAAAGSCYDKVRAKLPTAPIFVMVSPGGATTTGLSPFEDAFAAMIAARNDPNLFFIPMITDPAPWLTGSGNACVPTGDGNADYYIGSVMSGAPAVVSGGTGYAVNDVLSLPNPDPQALSVLLKVTAVSGGVVTAATANPGGNGNMVTKPANPVSTTALTGTGSGATFNINWGTAAPHTGFRSYQMMGERLAAAMVSAVAGRM